MTISDLLQIVDDPAVQAEIYSGSGTGLIAKGSLQLIMQRTDMRKRVIQHSTVRDNKILIFVEPNKQDDFLIFDKGCEIYKHELKQLFDLVSNSKLEMSDVVDIVADIIPVCNVVSVKDVKSVIRGALYGK